jgi:flagellar biosynthetic protein FlhB
MAEESDQEKTEQPSERRRQQAREEGQVPVSRELGTFVVLATGIGVLWLGGDWLVQRSERIVSRGLSFDRRVAFDPAAALAYFPQLALDGLVTLAPLFIALIVAGVAAAASLSGFNFSTKAFSPRFDRLSPLQGLKRMFSAHSLMELAKAVSKAGVVGLVAWWVVSRDEEMIFGLFNQSLHDGLGSAGHGLLVAAALLVAGLGVIAGIDVPFQLWQYTKRLRMSREELRQEAKEQEGDPQIKARIRSLQREMARKRMMADVPTADVVVTNPTHYSVALKYDRDKFGAPRVVAKGAGEVALKIREIAAEHQVPRLEAPPLARALYRHTDIGAQIPAALYRAVAEVMAYVYQLNHAAAHGGPRPEPPEDLEVPDGMDPGPGTGDL